MVRSNEWEVPIRSFELLEIWLSGETYLILYGPQAERVQFRFGRAAELWTPDGTAVRLDGGRDWEALVPLFHLRQRKVTGATVSVDARITLAFDDGSALAVSPDEKYESWELSGLGDLILVCPPGGGDPRICGGPPSWG